MNFTTVGEVMNYVYPVLLVTVILFLLVKIFYVDRKKSKNKTEYDVNMKKSFRKAWKKYVGYYLTAIVGVFIFLLPIIITSSFGGEAGWAGIFISGFIVFPIELVAIVIYFVIRNLHKK